jgi:small subunit ribosomal protein S4
MARPKIKISRRLGIAVTPKAHRYLEKRPFGPGMHGPNRRRGKQSDYGRQLVEKQKLRHQYNIRERQMVNYYTKAHRKTGNTADNLIRLLESRLDAAVLRAGFARTIYQARQLVGHGHFMVNGRKVNIPSYSLNVGDVVTVRQKSRELPAIVGSIEAGNPPAYLDVNPRELKVTVERLPERDEVPVECELSLVVEFYSR